MQNLQAKGLPAMALRRKPGNRLLVFRRVYDATAHDAIVRCLYPQSRSHVTRNWLFLSLAVENQRDASVGASSIGINLRHYIALLSVYPSTPLNGNSAGTSRQADFPWLVPIVGSGFPCDPRIGTSFATFTVTPAPKSREYDRRFVDERMRRS